MIISLYLSYDCQPLRQVAPTADLPFIEPIAEFPKRRHVFGAVDFRGYFLVGMPDLVVRQLLKIRSADPVPFKSAQQAISVPYDDMSFTDDKGYV